jgi:DNA-binding MarR family transcriptional regulator
LSIALIREVLDSCPDGTTPSERLVLVALAERASETDRYVYSLPGEDVRQSLRRRCGLSRSALTKVFQRLAFRGLEVRVEVGVAKDGRSVFAYLGSPTEFRVPVFHSLPTDPNGAHE